jgi:hypothetical protein
MKRKSLKLQKGTPVRDGGGSGTGPPGILDKETKNIESGVPEVSVAVSGSRSIAEAAV